jgi:hypothetical protein
LSLRVTHAWQNGNNNFQAGGSCGEDATSGVYCSEAVDWVGSVLGLNLTATATGQWRKYRVEYDKSAGALTGRVDGVVIGSWAVPATAMSGGYVAVGGGGPCCGAAQVGFSNLKMFQQL